MREGGVWYICIKLIIFKEWNIWDGNFRRHILYVILSAQIQ